MVWARMLWLSNLLADERYYGLGMFGHGCPGHPTSEKTNFMMNLGMDALATACIHG